MDAFDAALQALAMQDSVYLRRGGQRAALPRRPRYPERLSRITAAQKTGTMSCGKRRRLIKKEQLRPRAGCPCSRTGT